MKKFIISLSIFSTLSFFVATDMQQIYIPEEDVITPLELPPAH